MAATELRPRNDLVVVPNPVLVLVPSAARNSEEQRGGDSHREESSTYRPTTDHCPHPYVPSVVHRHQPVSGSLPCWFSRSLPTP